MTIEAILFLRKKSWKVVERIIYRFRYINVSVDKFLHDNARCYLYEGYGGKPVKEWPIYGFFSEFLCGRSCEVKQNWVSWYIEQYQKYGDIPKSLGGMKGGGIAKLVSECATSREGRLGGLEKDRRLFAMIGERVQERLNFADSIRRTGYRPDRRNPVNGYLCDDGRVVLKGGHHRVALLAAMGEQYVPCVLVREPRSVFRFFARNSGCAFNL